MATMRSGEGIFQPSVQRGEGGASCESPSGAVASAHAASAAISWEVSVGSLEKWPNCESANHGGILRSVTYFAMIGAYSRTSPYVVNDMGAISPALWQRWQCCCTMGKTSR